jgi:hypothetical protein
MAELEAALADPARTSGSCAAEGIAATDPTDAERLAPLLDAVDVELEQLEARLP